MRKLIYSALDDKNISDAWTITELARNALEEEHVSPFTQRIINAPPPKKFSPPKFIVYNSRSDLVDYVCYYKQVMAY